MCGPMRPSSPKHGRRCGAVGASRESSSSARGILTVSGIGASTRRRNGKSQRVRADVEDLDDIRNATVPAEACLATAIGNTLGQPANRHEVSVLLMMLPASSRYAASASPSLTSHCGSAMVIVLVWTATTNSSTRAQQECGSHPSTSWPMTVMRRVTGGIVRNQHRVAGWAGAGRCATRFQV
jgi:hypothetical protein